MLIEIDYRDRDKYRKYLSEKVGEFSSKNVSQCKYFCKIPMENNWDKIEYFWDKKKE